MHGYDFAEEATGVWRFGAEAEADTTREPVDLRAPFGGLSDDIKGVAVYPATTELAYLLVADVGNEHPRWRTSPPAPLRGSCTQSLVIGTGKKSGLYVFDLEGLTLQVLEDGRMNNVDLRDGILLGGQSVSIVAASNRSNDGISLYRIDGDARELVDVADGVLATGFADPDGLCLYQSPDSRDFFVFVNDSGSGLVRQWRLADNGAGRIAAEAVRDLPVGSQAEGCVADDQNGTLYIAEEDIGLWKYSAEPDGGDERTSIDTTNESGRLTADVEGAALYDAGGGSGYLVLSNQGANNYAVYRREGDNAFVGFFHIVANAAEGIDGASETDGLDVSPAALGEAYPDGLLVVQDGRNIAPEERQNFKYVSWSDVVRALKLD